MPADSPLVASRRRALRRWIEIHHGGKQAAFIAAAKINQGELSGLLRDKSFGEKKAANLEATVGMPDGYLVNPAVELDSDISSGAGRAAGRDPSFPKRDPDLDALLALATPNSRTQLKRIAQAAADGRLTEKDVELLRLIADRFAKPG